MIAVDPDLMMYTVYENPTDFPGLFVVRRWFVTGAAIGAERQPFAVGSSLADVRRHLPRGLYRTPRSEHDEPQIVETWL